MCLSCCENSTQRKKVVDSLVFEAEAHLRNPNGCLDFVHNLENRLMEVQQEIDNVKSELTKYISPEVIQFVMDNPNNQVCSSQIE
jgi:hypothetical protein